MNLDALRSLQKQASPGEWRTSKLGLGDRHEADDFVVSADGASVLRSWGTSRSTEEESANAKLAAISKNHLLPISEALEEAIDNNTQGTAKAYHEPPCDECMGCRSRTALKDLQEALDA